VKSVVFLTLTQRNGFHKDHHDGGYGVNPWKPSHTPQFCCKLKKFWIILHKINGIRNTARKNPFSVAQATKWTTALLNGVHIHRSAVCIQSRLKDGCDAARIPARSRGFSLLHLVQTGCEAQPTTYSMDTGNVCRV